MSSISSALSSLLSSSPSSSYDLSSILEAAFGASSPGIDVTAAVNSAVNAAEAPEQTWQAEESIFQSQTTSLNQIQSDASNLSNDLQNLYSLAGPLSELQATSSNTSLLTASAVAGTAIGNHVVEVNGLASTASWTSAAFSSGSAAMPAGTFTITPQGGAGTPITTDGTETLSQVASQINTDKLGVTASVVTDDSGSRLAIVANSSGAASNFNIGTTTTAFGFGQDVTGADSSVTVDGITRLSPTNTVTGAISGVTLNLLSANPGTQVTLGIAPDTSSASSAINQFVTDYNAVMKDMNSQFKFNGTSEGALSGDTTVRNLQSVLLGAASYTYSPSSGTTSMPNLSSMGITMNNDGTLSVDSGTLQNALQNNYGDVQSFFQGSALNGFANSLDKQVSSFTSVSDGAFTVDLQSINGQISDLQTNISNFQTNYIAPLQTQLQTEYSQAEAELQQLPLQMQEINAELGNTSSKG